MKVFQIKNDICFWETPYSSISETVGRYPPNILFAEAPDHVFEGWGYVDGEFIQPVPPEGWNYDPATGGFYPDGGEPTPIQEPIPTEEDDLMAMTIDHEYRITLLELGVF